MNISESHISYPSSGRYFILGDLSPDKHLIIALHGHGHLAAYFIQKFKNLDLDKYVIVCPEAPNRYYKNGTEGRVGATWMTKEDRLTDIQNYISLLDNTLDELKSNQNFNSISLLGFSQGGATASRWLAYGKHQFDKFLLWATVFPPDMDPEYCEKFNHSANYFVFGTKDDYYSENKVKKHFEELNKLNLRFELIIFDGTHDINEETLQSIFHS